MLRREVGIYEARHSWGFTCARLHKLLCLLAQGPAPTYSFTNSCVLSLNLVSKSGLRVRGLRLKFKAS